MLASNPAAKEVNIESMEKAIKLVAYFVTQAWRVMPLIRDNKLIEVERCKTEIRRKLSGCRSMKKRDLQKNSAFTAEVFNQALYDLACPGVEIYTDGTVRIYDPTNRQMDLPDLPSVKPTQAPSSDETDCEAEQGVA
jgi:hypothetical protein